MVLFLVMGFLDNLIKIRNTKQPIPRKPEEIEDPEIIISPDTRRANRMPPGQSRTKKWPVLDAHGTPDIDLATWSFEVDGLVEQPRKVVARRVYATRRSPRLCRLSLRDALVATRQRLERRLNKRDRATRRRQTRKLNSSWPLAYDYGWTTNVPIEYFLNDDSLFAWSHDGQPIPPEHGGPVRLIIPQLYAWKSAKWVKGVRFLEHDQAGYWEEGGYHMRGIPWRPGDGERFRWS